MLAAGTRLFAEREYDAVSMDEIASAADVSKPMVYAYFESKQGLFLACVEHWTHELMDRVGKATPDDLPPDVRMWHGLLAVFTFIEENPDGWALLSPHGPAAGGQLAAGAASIRREFTALLARMLRDAAVAGGVDPDVARQSTEPFAHAIAAAVQGVAAYWKRESAGPGDRQALQMMNFVWMGLDNLMRGELWLPPPGGTSE